MHNFKLVMAVGMAILVTEINSMWVNDCDKYGDSVQAEGLNAGQYFCEIDTADNFTGYYETVSTSRSCYTPSLEQSGYYWKSSYETYFSSPFPNSNKQKCGEYCLTIGSTCRGFTLRTGSGNTMDQCLVHTTNPDSRISDSYNFAGPYEGDHGYSIATSGGSSGHCYVKVGRRSDFTTTSTTRTTVLADTTKTTTSINPADLEDGWWMRSSTPGTKPTFTTKPVAYRNPTDEFIQPVDDITDQFVLNSQLPREEYVFVESEITKRNEIIVFKDTFLSTDDTIATGEPESTICCTPELNPTVASILGGQAFEVHNGGLNGFLSLSDVRKAQTDLADYGAASFDGHNTSVDDVRFDVTRGAILVDIDDAAGLLTVVDAANKALNTLSLGVGGSYNYRAQENAFATNDDEKMRDPPVRPQAGWVRALLGNSTYNELYTDGEMDNVQLIITRQRKPNDAPKLSPVMPKRRDEFADIRNRVGAGNNESVIMIFNPQTYRRPVATQGSGDKFDKSVQRAVELMRGGCFRQVKSAVGIQFLSQQQGHGVKLAKVDGEQGCARVEQWCTGTPDEVVGIDYSSTPKKGPPLNRCVMPAPCRSSYDPDQPDNQPVRFCVAVLPCRDSTECPDAIKSTTEVRLEQYAVNDDPDDRDGGDGHTNGTGIDAGSGDAVTSPATSGVYPSAAFVFALSITLLLTSAFAI